VFVKICPKPNKEEEQDVYSVPAMDARRRRQDTPVILTVNPDCGEC